MQYILSEEEYAELTKKQMLDELRDKEALFKFCMRVCKEMPTLYWGNTEKKVWACPHDPDYNGMTYCDNCPATEFCPKPKAYSK